MRSSFMTRSSLMTLAAAGMVCGALASSALAQAADVAAPPPNPVVQTVPAPPSAPVQPLDCRGTTGAMGCGPGWFWRDGWRGWACYPC
jgi:hypothetical protein